jgi:hypothetical protein
VREQIGIDVTARDLASKELQRVNGAVDRLAASTGKAAPATDALGGAQMGMGQKAFFALQNLQSVQWAISTMTSMMTPAVNAARDWNESVSKVNVVLGEHADVLLKAAETSARTMGLSGNQVLAMGSEYANLFRAMKMTEEESANMSLATVQMASDISSFNNIPMDDALGKLRSGLVGEYLPLRTVGVQLNEIVVANKAMQMGLADSKQAITQQDKVMARFALITEQLDLTVGDFARTQFGLANQQRVAAAVMDDNMRKAGQALLPIFLALTQASIGFMDVIIPIITLLGTQFPAIAAGVVAALIAMAGGFVPATMAVWGFATAAWAAIVPFLPFIAIGVVVAGALMVLEAKFGFVTGAIHVLSEAIGAIVGFIKSALVVAIQILANIVGFFDKDMAKSLNGMADAVNNIGKETTDTVKATEEESRAIIARAIPGMENVSADYFNTMPDAAGNAKEAVLKRTSETMAGVASSLKNGRDAVKNAADFLKQALKDAVSPAKEKKDLNKFLDSKELKKALESQDAVVRAAALSAQQAAKERLFALEQGVPDAAVTNQVSYDDAYKAAADAKLAELEAQTKAAQDAAALQLSNNMYRWGERTMLAYGEGMTSAKEAVKAHLRGVMADLVPVVEAHSPPGMHSPLHNIDEWGARTVTAFGDGMRKAGAALRQSASLAVGATRPEFESVAALGVSNAAASAGQPVVINNNFQPGSVRKDDDIRRITERIHVQARLRGGLHGGGASATAL